MRARRPNLLDTLCRNTLQTRSGTPTGPPTAAAQAKRPGRPSRLRTTAAPALEGLDRGEFVRGVLAGRNTPWRAAVPVSVLALLAGPWSWVPEQMSLNRMIDAERAK